MPSPVPVMVWWFAFVVQNHSGAASFSVVCFGNEQLWELVLAVFLERFIAVCNICLGLNWRYCLYVCMRACVYLCICVCV